MISKGKSFQMILPWFLVVCFFVARPVVTQTSLFSPNEPIIQLHTSNFSSVIHNSPKMWIVDFYAAWCGYCQRLAPEYSAFARNVREWYDVVGVAAVACSDPANSALCRNYGISGYPSIRFFPPNSTTSFRGYNYEGDKLAPGLHTAILEYLLQAVRQGETDRSWPKLEDVRNPSQLWQGREVRAVYVVVENQTMTSGHVGLMTILDSLDLRPKVVVGRMTSQNAEAYGAKSPGLYLSTSFGNLLEVVREASQDKIIEAIRSRAGNTAGPVANSALATTSTPSKDNFKYTPPKGLHMQDLESSLYYSLWIELPSRDVFSGETLTALKNYVNLLAKYHPGEAHVKTFLNRINQWVSTQQNSISAQAWLQKLNSTQSNDAYIKESLRWTGCSGSLPKFRGYPCSLWMTFHALTVSAYVKESSDASFNPLDVLLPIRDYIKYFLGCRQCAENFGRRSQNLEQMSLAPRDVVLWLWKIHNQANSHLHGDPTEDPQHPKVQFPSYEACPQCRTKAAANLRFNLTDDAWNEDKVLAYLVSYYRQQSIIDDDVDEVPAQQPSGDGKDSSSCLPFASDWTTCSRTCDTGISTRYAQDQSTGCNLQAQVRLCLVRPCMTQFPDWTQSAWHVASCPRHGHTYRLTRKISMSYGNCSTTTSEAWRVCGRCPDLMNRPVCCRPVRSFTQPRNVTCLLRSPEGQLKEVRGKMMVEVVDYCRCDENC